ncbi:hypothetical protein [Amycolatopsis sp. NPDC050768]|uniref:hypothetical protein n=1 Tax=unclassified Amycolatopsis TaxID=2618356 RepID=UPI003404DE47
MDNAYPELVEALDRRGGPRFVADREIVAFDGDNTSFAALQPRIRLTTAQRKQRLARKADPWRDLAKRAGSAEAALASLR